MKTYFKTGILLITCLLGCALPAAAQKMTKVTGIVYNIAGRKKIPFSDIAVQVYAAKTVAEGKDIKKALRLGSERPRQADHVPSRQERKDYDRQQRILRNHSARQRQP